MKVVDLHPEELLDKDARGELTELETERLEAHLARCATCRFEREVRADFAAELDEDDGYPSQRVTALVEGLPKKAPPPEPQIAEDETPPATRRRAGRRNVRVILLVAAALFAGSLATAGVGARVWEHLTAGSNSEDLTVTPPGPPSPSTLVAVAPSASTSEHIFIEHDEAAAAVQVASAAPAAELAPTPSESAATLFEAASEARRRGDYAQALTLHRRLQTQFASSREAHASQATVGRLLLDRGDATGALASFDAYQKHGSGFFDEPVMVGRATALERLGRSDDAREAWRALVASFPDTPWRSHAEARLATMATSTP